LQQVVRKTQLLSHFIPNIVILPRQARDKHRENSEEAFCAECCEGVLMCEWRRFQRYAAVWPGRPERLAALESFPPQLCEQKSLRGFLVASKLAEYAEGLSSTLGLELIDVPFLSDDDLQQVRKRLFLRHLYIKPNILPRQARDKHRENSKRETVLCRSSRRSFIRSAFGGLRRPCRSCRRPQRLLRTWRTCQTSLAVAPRRLAHIC
jgi:hypothetical protein